MMGGSLTDPSLVISSARIDARGLVVVVLTNRGKSSLKLWAANNYEGMKALSFVFTDSKGNKIAIQPPVPPRAGGVATAIELRTGAKLELAPVDLSWAVNKGKVRSGHYSVIAVYSNDLADEPPVQGVWTGTIRSKAFSVNL